MVTVFWVLIFKVVNDLVIDINIGLSNQGISLKERIPFSGSGSALRVLQNGFKSSKFPELDEAGC